VNCEGCEKPMWLDYPIDDDIPLCHECYVSYAESGGHNERFRVV
jgi:hypothetical protein